jgi:membrane protein
VQLSSLTGFIRAIPPAWKRTLHYMVQTEGHVYAFSMAANVLLSFFPFLMVIITLCRNVFHWGAAEQAIYIALNDYFGGELGYFLKNNLLATLYRSGRLEWTSVLLLLFTANGIFEPLEVALNRAWGITKNRSFLRNQMISLGMIFITGSLVLASALLTAYNQEMLGRFGFNAFVASVLFKLAAVPLSMLALFLIYWLLPNGRVPILPLIPVSIGVGLALESMKYLVLAIWPWMSRKFYAEYGPFQYSVAIVFLSFLASMIVLAGAEWAARSRSDSGEDSRPDDGNP